MTNYSPSPDCHGRCSDSEEMPEQPWRPDEIVGRDERGWVIRRVKGKKPVDENPADET